MTVWRPPPLPFHPGAGRVRSFAGGRTHWSLGRSRQTESFECVPRGQAKVAGYHRALAGLTPPPSARPSAPDGLRQLQASRLLPSSSSSSFSYMSLASAPYRIPHTVRLTPPRLPPTPPSSPTRPLQLTATLPRTHVRSVHADVSGRSGGRSSREARHHTPTYAILSIE